MTGSLERRRAKRRPWLGEALGESGGAQVPSGRLSHGGRDHGAKPPHRAWHHLSTRRAEALAQGLAEGLAGEAHAAGGWVGRALRGHVESRAHRAGRERRWLSPERLGTTSAPSAIAWGHLACHAPLDTEASEGDRTTEEGRSSARHLRGSEVILEGVGCDQVIHHGRRGRRKLRQMRVGRALAGDGGGKGARGGRRQKHSAHPGGWFQPAQIRNQDGPEEATEAQRVEDGVHLNTLSGTQKG